MINLIKKIRKIILYKILNLETKGVRICAFDKNKILLIKHPYDDFWVFPGGGVKKNEDYENSAARELLEETNYRAAKLQKFGVYRNGGDKNDTVTLFITHEVTQTDQKQRMLDRLEVQEIRWFEINKLPKLSSATKRRIKEIVNNEFSKNIRKW